MGSLILEFITDELYIDTCMDGCHTLSNHDSVTETGM